MDDGPRRTGTIWTLNVAIAMWILIVLLVTVPRSPWEEASEPRVVHALPFEELLNELRKDDPAPWLVVAEMLGNVVLFFPLGLLVPLRWAAWRNLKKLLAAAALFSLAVEGLQFGLGFGRRASSTDLVLNTVGACLGYFTLLLIWRLRRAPARLSSGSRQRIGSEGRSVETGRRPP